MREAVGDGRKGKKEEKGGGGMHAFERVTEHERSSKKEREKREMKEFHDQRARDP